MVSISEAAYLSLPRGGMSDMHVLAVPVECVPNRLMASNGDVFDFTPGLSNNICCVDTLSDLDRYCAAINRMYESVDCRMLTFERAIR